MHNRILFFSTILAAVLAASCAKADLTSTSATPGNEMGGGTKLDTLYSSLEQPGGTKLQLSDTYDLLWQDGDKIYVISSSAGPEEFTLVEGKAGSKQGTFTGTLPDGTPLYAVFGADQPLSSISISDSKLNFKVTGSRENYQVGNIASNGIPAVAKVGDGGTVGLCNVFGLLRLDFTGTGIPAIKKIVLHDLAGNPLWGTCSVPIMQNGDLDYENATVTNTADGANSISVEFGSAQSLDGKQVYFPVPANALDGGFSVVLYDATGAAYSFLQKITSPVAVPRSRIVYVGASVTPKSEPLDVKGRGYYKSLFFNAGYGLDSFGSGDDKSAMDDVPAIAIMGLANDCEYYSCSKNEAGLAKQTSVIVGSDIDANGVLLYPDGSPRFRMVFNCGGNSKSHGKSLGSVGRSRYRDFFNNGGSYSGVCAGSFLAGKYVDNTNHSTDYTYGFVPVNLRHTNLPYPMDEYDPIYTNMEILSDAKNTMVDLNDKYGYSKFDLLLGEKTDKHGNMETYNVSDIAIKDVMHHGGSYLYFAPTTPQTELPTSLEKVPGLEALMKYRYSTTDDADVPGTSDDGESNADHYYKAENLSNKLFTYATNSATVSGSRDGEISTWAYKLPDGNTGRAVCTGSHPEGTGRDCDNQFIDFMFSYAMDGNGDPIVKHGTTEWNLGETIYMSDTPSSYSNSASNNAPIGDRQYHHFKFTTNSVTENFVLRLDSACDKDSGIDLYLGLRHQVSTDGTKDLAWLSDADYTLCNKGGQKEIRIKSLPAGVWYVSVFCATTVTSDEKKDDFPKYFVYSGKTQVLNGVPYSISIAQGESLKDNKDYFPVPLGTDGDDFANTMDD